MKNNALLKTNFLVSLILITGFMLTALFGYQANYRASLDSIEQVSDLTAEGIYYQLTSIFTKPVNISLTMAHDSLLKAHPAEESRHLEDPAYIEDTKSYLNAYQDKYGFDSVFLVSTASGRYYNFNDLDRVLTQDNPENAWYYSLLDGGGEFTLQVDNDEVAGADNKITVFINCRITDADGGTLGVVGVGIRVDHLKELLASYEAKFNIDAYLLDDDGSIEISTTHTGYEQVDWFQTYGQENNRQAIMSWKSANENLSLWTDPDSENQSYIVTRYIPELSWHLVVEQDTSRLVAEMRQQLYKTALMILAIICTVLFVTTTVIRHFNRQITELLEEKQAIFKRATEQLYDNIYELNITENRSVGQRTEQYFESLGAKGLPYDQALKVIAEKQVKPEYQAGYIATFSPENVLREYEKGSNHLCYDFMLTRDGANYFWMRIDAFIFHSAEDNCLHMFTYHKNIDQEKQAVQKAETDEMTGFYSKKATERAINGLLAANPGQQYAFFIFDIDNFKQANDRYGHAFGDLCIHTFTDIIRSQFRAGDVLGRIGGDEFVAFIPIPSHEWLHKKAQSLSAALHTTCQEEEISWTMSASIGIAVTPESGTDFPSVYRNADLALYETKKAGKNNFTIYTPQD